MLPMVCVFTLLNELPPKYCPLCRIKRAHEEQYLLEQGLEEETSQINSFPFTPDVYCFEEERDPSDANCSELKSSDWRTRTRVSFRQEGGLQF